MNLKKLISLFVFTTFTLVPLTSHARAFSMQAECFPVGNTSTIGPKNLARIAVDVIDSGLENGLVYSVKQRVLKTPFSLVDSQISCKNGNIIIESYDKKTTYCQPTEEYSVEVEIAGQKGSFAVDLFAATTMFYNKTALNNEVVYIGNLKLGGQQETWLCHDISSNH